LASHQSFHAFSLLLAFGSQGGDEGMLRSALVSLII
jgi:hypothetical protein